MLFFLRLQSLESVGLGLFVVLLTFRYTSFYKYSGHLYGAYTQELNGWVMKYV